MAQEAYYNDLKAKRKTSSKANYKSEILIMKRRKQKLSEIFDALDSDKDNQISFINLNVKGLSGDLQKIFKPLFNELELIQQPLDKDEFIDAATRLYEVMFLL